MIHGKINAYLNIPVRVIINPATSIDRKEIKTWKEYYRIFLFDDFVSSY